MKMTRQRFGLLLAILCVLFASNSQAAVRSVFVQSRLDYNAILITNVDLVFLYDENAVSALPQNKSAWLSGKEAFLETAGDGADLVSVFIPQGFDSAMMSLPERRGQAIKVVVFGEHDSSTRPPIDITGRENVLVEIDQFGIIVSSRD